MTTRTTPACALGEAIIGFVLFAVLSLLGRQVPAGMSLMVLCGLTVPLLWGLFRGD